MDVSSSYDFSYDTYDTSYDTYDTSYEVDRLLGASPPGWRVETPASASRTLPTFAEDKEAKEEVSNVHMISL